MSQLTNYWKNAAFAPAQAFREMDHFLEDWASRREASAALLQPKCEVAEDKGHYIVKLDAPGVAKDQIKVEYYENQLHISGERKEEKKEDSK